MMQTVSFATARRPKLELEAIWSIKQEFPRAGVQFIANRLGVSMEDVRRHLEPFQ